MDFISNQQPQIDAMLASIGVASIDELFKDVPHQLKQQRPVHDDGISEYEGVRLMEAIASRNTFPSFENYLGAGAYEHHVPALVGAICSKSEFLTSYTPYQAEASQGMLQIIFEFQSAICALTGMDVANASVYDGASACAEAVLMALRAQKEKNKVLIVKSVHPHYQDVIRQYVREEVATIEWIDVLDNGSVNVEDLKNKLNEQTATVLIQSPNFFGVIENVAEISRLAKEKGALTILCANPLVYGLFASANELGADIAVGDCQPLGLPMHFGGPYVGYMACKQELVRQMPGRIVGETVDTQNRRGFVLTLQAREQHIRREKATSNICTNQALAALATLVGMLWYGKEGLKALALTNYQRANYLKQQLGQVKGIQIVTSGTTFNEFVIRFQTPLKHVQDIFLSHRIVPGVDLEKYYPEMNGCLLVAVTETKTKEQLDHFCEIARRSCEESHR